MQLSIKTPPELTLPILEKCAVLAEEVPSRLVTDLVWQCVKWMDMPHARFHPLKRVLQYYGACGSEDKLLAHKSKRDKQIERLMENDRVRRQVEATERLKKFRVSLKKRPAPKHLHLKISQGMNDLPQRIKAKADWLRISPNALVVACVQEGIEAMNDPMKAMLPPPIVAEYWSVSHAKAGREVGGSLDVMLLETIEGMLRKRSGPIVDTIIRHTLAEEWNVTLRDILREADALSDEWMPKK